MHGSAPYVLKPPLMIWLTSAAYSAFGVNSFAATFFSRLFGVLCIVLTITIGRRFFGKAAGWWAGLILLTTNPFLTNATNFRMETGLLLGILLGFYALFASRNWWRPWLFFASIVIGVMAKGPPGLLPILLGIVYFANSRRSGHPWITWDQTTRRWAMAALLLILPAAWYLYLEHHLGPAVYRELVADALTGQRPLIEQLASVWEHYVLRPLLRNAEWVIPTAAGLWAAARTLAAGRSLPRPAAHRRRRVYLVLLLSIALTFLIASAKPAHRLRYLLPAAPAMSWLAGREMARWTRARVPVWLSGAMLLLSVIAFGLSQWAPLPWPTSFTTHDDIVRMHEILDRELPAGAPVALVTREPVKPNRWGRQWSEMDWATFYLGRELVYVDPDSLEGRKLDRPFLLCFKDRQQLMQVLPATRIAHSTIMDLMRPEE